MNHRLVVEPTHLKNMLVKNGFIFPNFWGEKKIYNYHPVISWGDTLKNIQLQNMTRLGAKFPCKKTPHHESL